ncbi:MAG: hypothetical protein FJ197_08120 [Gammaproteobacteria bacterium]|nr:hypothetical protein [Gammaproteobacteria bacterium]
MTSLSSLLHRLATRWTILFVTLVYAYFIASIMPAQSLESSAYAGDWGAPDRQLHYSPEEFYAQVSTWGEAGQRHYIDFRLGLDIVWAFAYSGFLILVTSAALRYAVPAGDGRLKLNLAGIVPLVSDLFENALGIWLVAEWPTRHDLVAALAAAVTFIKWSSLVAAHVVMIVAIVMSIRTWIRKRGAHA